MPAPSRRRALGQHFLRDPGIARAIVELTAPGPDDLVVEMGPGEGALTAELARRAGRVIALEVDRELIARLRTRFPTVEVLEADARAWDYGIASAPAGGRVLVIGNLPYSVSKPILMALVKARTALASMVLMLQREVAERLAAPPGSKTYGSLSVLTQLYCDVEVALRVPPGAFRPPPKVESAVVRLTPLPKARIDVGDERWFHTVVRAAFAQRRKIVVNTLATSLRRPIEEVRQAAYAAGIDPTCRAEILTIDDFARVASRLS